jgi:hypothetical protein
MSLLDDLKIDDAAKVNMAEEQERMASGGLCPKGVHQAVLDAASQLILGGEKRGYKLTFKVLAGPGKDLTAEDVVWLPKGENEATDKKLKTRALMYGSRLGLIKVVKHSSGIEVPAPIEGKTDFCDCLGQIAFIDVIHEEETWEKDGKQRSAMKAKLAYEGVLKPDDKKVTNVPRASSAQLAASASSPTPSQKPAAAKDNYADL